MSSTLIGLVLLALAHHYVMVLISVAFVGIGSSVFHPEASRVARLASGGRHGFAQSLFQVGGNAGTSFGPLLAAWIILPHGQFQLIWFSLVALAGIILLTRVGHWYRGNMERLPLKKRVAGAPPTFNGRVIFALAILVALVFSNYFYLTSMSSYYTFFLIDKLEVPPRKPRNIFSSSSPSPSRRGRSPGGSLGDKFYRKHASIWASILGVTPFTPLTAPTPTYRLRPPS